METILFHLYPFYFLLLHALASASSTILKRGRMDSTSLFLFLTRLL